MSPLLRSWNEVRTWNIWADECLGVWTPWVVWECEDWNSGNGNSLLRRSPGPRKQFHSVTRLPQETTCFQRQKKKQMGLPLGWFKLTQRKECRGGNMAQENLQATGCGEWNHSVPQLTTQERSRWNCPDSENIWFLSHIDSLERIVRGGLETEKQKKRSGKGKREAV